MSAYSQFDPEYIFASIVPVRQPFEIFLEIARHMNIYEIMHFMHLLVFLAALRGFKGRKPRPQGPPTQTHLIGSSRIKTKNRFRLTAYMKNGLR